MPEKAKKSGINTGNIFWGAILILIGSLFLLDNLNIVDVDLYNILRLWPLLIIAAGLSVLNIRGWLGGILTGILVIVSIALITVVVTNNGNLTNTSSSNQSISIPQESGTKNAVVEVNAGAGELNIAGRSMNELVQAEIRSDDAKLEQQSTTTGDTQKVILSLKSDSQWMMSSPRNDIDVDLSEEVPMELNIDSGASRIEGDLKGLNLSKLFVKSGMSTIDLTIGNKVDSTSVELDVGMSTTNIRVPEESGVSLRLDAGMSSRNIPGLKEVSPGYFESDNFSSASKKILITGKIGMTTFELERY